MLLPGCGFDLQRLMLFMSCFGLGLMVCGVVIVIDTKLATPHLVLFVWRMR